MKIIWTDNYGKSGESPGYDEKFVAIGMNKFYADKICELLNHQIFVHGDTNSWYRVVEDDYKLQIFEP